MGAVNESSVNKKKQMDVEAELVGKQKENPHPAFQDISFTSSPAAGQAAKTGVQLWVWVAVAYHTLAWNPE